MNKNDIAKFAYEFRTLLKEYSANALEFFNWAERLDDLGFEMDCGHSFVDKYDIFLGDDYAFKCNARRIDDIQTLGKAIFSQCRYMTHWSTSPENGSVNWLILALKRLEELATNNSYSMPAIITYRFAEIVTATIKDFCKRALLNEPLPWRVNYDVHSIDACDATIDEIYCSIEMGKGDVDLSFEVIQTTWGFVGQNPSKREPRISDL